LLLKVGQDVTNDMRQKTRKESTKEIQKKAGRDLIKQDLNNREELVSVRSEQVRKGELSVQEFADELKLTDIQRKFCIEFVKPENLGKQLSAYAIAADLDLNDDTQYHLAKDGGSRLADHAGCVTLINCLLQSQGLSQENAKNQLLFLINQMGDKKTKLRALELFWKMTGELKKHTEIVHKHEYDFKSMDPEKLRLLIKLKEEAKIGNTAFTPTSGMSTLTDFIEDIEVVAEKAKKKNDKKIQKIVEEQRNIVGEIETETIPETLPEESIEDEDDPWEFKDWK
jgi:hypothetical protein